MQEEKHGSRDLAYSAWHRRLSTRRYVGIENAQRLAMIDLDAALYVEYDDSTRHPLAIIETARDVGQSYKSATVSASLARLAGLPCYCVLYSCAAWRNPAAPEWPDVAGFRVRRVWPSPESSWRTLTPAEWARALLSIREHLAWTYDRSQSQGESIAASAQAETAITDQLELLSATV